ACLPQSTKTMRMVDRGTWQQAKNQVLQEIHEDLYSSVQGICTRVDQQRQIAAETRRSAALEGNLWVALCGLVHNGVELKPSMDGLWPEPLSFKFADLEAKLPAVDKTVLRAVLDELTATSVLEGLVADKNRFLFANNLLPMWLKYSGEFF
ncbi:MAG: hypothetical protein ABL925_20600, partial [Methylococcales bacterium]